MKTCDRTTLADKRAAHVFVTRLAIKPRLRWGIANFQHAARRVDNTEIVRNALGKHSGLIEAAGRKPSRSKRQSDDSIGTRVGFGIRTDGRDHGIGEQLRERQILVELECLHQSIERKAVLKCGNGCVKGGWIGKAFAAHQRRWRRRGAARACRSRGSGQIAAARAAKTCRGADSAERAILRKNSTEGWRPKQCENMNRLAETKKEMTRMPISYAIVGKISHCRRNKYSRSAMFFTKASARSYAARDSIPRPARRNKSARAACNK